jgi:protoporphyrinogen oxidase
MKTRPSVADAMKDPVVVLGAGPAGITAGWRLAERGQSVVVLEREGAVGGMGKTVKLGAFGVDFGPHTFHIRETDESREVIRTIKPFFGKDPLILTRGTRVFLQGKYYIYPLELLQVLSGVRPTLAARIIFDYVIATAKTMLTPPKKEDSFEEWGVRNLGRTLYDLCFGVYSERVWGLPTAQISSKQAQRVAKLSLMNIILRTLGIKSDPQAHFTEYMYPRAGISDLYENMAARFRECGGQLLLESPVVGLERDGNRITAVRYRANGREQAIACSGVVSTLPLPLLVKLISPALSNGVADHAAKLRYRSLKLVYIVLNREQLTDFHWVYLLDKDFRINRVSEQKNVSPYMVPKNQTVLCVEISCWKHEPIWTASDSEVFEIALRDMQKTGYGIERSEVAEYHVLGIETAYPVYELNFEEHLIPVLQGVHSLDNLLTIGRHGLFLNNSMDDNVLLGTQVADRIVDRGFESAAWLEQMLAFMNLRFQGK